MNHQVEILKSCKELPYSKTKKITGDICRATISELRVLFGRHGYSNVLGVLAGVWCFEDAVSFWKAIVESQKYTELFGDVENEDIKTIGTAYHKLRDGGVERVEASLMNIWVSMGLNVVCFSEEKENSNDYKYPETVKRVLFSKNNMVDRLNVLQEQCLQNRIDLFVEHDWTNPCVIWEIVLMKLLHVKFSLYCHGHFSWCFGYGKRFLYQPECFRMCDLVLAISETNARFYQMCGCKTYLLQNPVPNELLELYEPVRSKSNRILFIGRLAKEKYPIEALEIFKLVLETVPDAKLDIVGDGKLRSEMQEYVIKHDLQGSVIFHGFKSSCELDKYYREACCVLFTSKMEGYPMVVLESKAYGLPLIMYEMPYLSLLNDGKGFLAAPTGDCHMMAENLLKILSDENCREAIGRDALESFRNLKNHNHVKDWGNVFDIVCDKQFENNERFFGVEKLNAHDKWILPVLMERINQGYITELENNKDYRFGRAILKYPRAIYRILRRIKRKIMK